MLRDAIAADPEALPRPRPRRALGRRPRAAGQAARRRRAPARSTSTPAAASRASTSGSRFGKTEAWIILEAEPGAAVHVGPREPLEPATVRGWVDAQDADEMLAALHRVPVAAGDAVLVPAGTLHAIGAGILLLELPGADRPVRAAWSGSRSASTTGAEHLGLGWEPALQALDREPADLPALTTGGRRRPAARRRRPYFRAERVARRRRAGAVVRRPVVTGGRGRAALERRRRARAAPRHHRARAVRRGRHDLAGDVEAIRCLPPAPTAGEGDW